MTHDDLFTTIHKALRHALFEITVRAGATDWSDADDVEQLGARWHPLLELLQSHTRHEDEHILRILDPFEAVVTDPIAEQHRDLEDLLDHVATEFDGVLAEPAPERGLALYRDLARFVAAYLPHLHEEETVVMPRIWARCTDEEIAATRAAFMAVVPPEQTALSLEYLLPAIDRAERAVLVGRLAATAPPPVLDLALGIADRVLSTEEAAALREDAAAA